jgi:DNA polymerase-4
MSLKIMFVDMNAYFASVEQQYRPELRGKPVGVVPVQADSTCCIAASYEARKFGVKTGTMVRDARKMCPSIKLVEARHELYVRVHHMMIAAVETCLPVRRIHSIDEVSCRLSTMDLSPDRALQKGREVKEAIRRRVGEFLPCSVGLAPNGFLAKVAADMQKPNGLTVIAREDLPHKLYPLDLIDFPGIGRACAAGSIPKESKPSSIFVPFRRRSSRNSGAASADRVSGWPCRATRCPTPPRRGELSAIPTFFRRS